MNKEAFQSFYNEEQHQFLLSVSHDDIQDHFAFSFCNKQWHWLYGNLQYPEGLENEATLITGDPNHINWAQYPNFDFIFMKGDFNFLKDLCKRLPKMMALECKVTWHMNDSTFEKESQLAEILRKQKVMPIDTTNHLIPKYRNIRLGSTQF